MKSNTTDKRKITIHMGMCIVIFLFHLSITYGQSKPDKVFDVLPSPIREKLIERLKLRIDYERDGDWGKLYDILFEPQTNKEDYIKQNKDIEDDLHFRMIDFTPRKISLLYPNTDIYEIEGCVTESIKGKTHKVNDIIEARLVNGEWYFAYFGVVYNDNSCEK
jgi:hypothetical protein